MTGCKNWEPKFHHRQYCELGNETVKFACADCIHLKFTKPSKEEMDSLPPEERQDLRVSVVTEPTKTLLDEPFDLKAEERARKALDLIKNNPDAFNGCVEKHQGDKI